MKLAAVLVALALALAGPARAQQDFCNLGFAPQAPDGRSADDAIMRTAREQMNAFVKRADEFLSCIEQADAEAKAAYQALKNPTPEQTAVYKVRKEDLDRRYNAGVDAQKAAADRFNEQLRIFRAKNGLPAGKNG